MPSLLFQKPESTFTVLASSRIVLGKTYCWNASLWSERKSLVSLSFSCTTEIRTLKKSGSQLTSGSTDFSLCRRMRDKPSTAWSRLVPQKWQIACLARVRRILIHRSRIKITISTWKTQPTTKEVLPAKSMGRCLLFYTPNELRILFSKIY